MPPITIFLEPTRTYSFRSVSMERTTDGAGWDVTAVRKSVAGKSFTSTDYSIHEFDPDYDWDGRAFRVAKHEDGTQYNVFVDSLAPTMSTCDCAGGTYAPGRPVEQRSPGLGCIHLDTIRAMIAEGLFDSTNPLTAPIPVE